MSAIGSVALLLAISVSVSAETIAELTLRDQYDQEDSVAAPRGEVVMVMVITAKRLRKLKRWEVELRSRFADLHFIRVADIPGEPPLTEEQVARKIALWVPKDISVLLDMDRAWASALPLKTRSPNLVLFNRAGNMTARFRGPVSADFLDVVSEQVEKAMAAP